MPLAYFLTFSTYGTWLHGSAEGSADTAHNVYGTPMLAPDAAREEAARAAMVQPPYVMSAPEREIVCKAIVTLCAERGWFLLAVHVRSNHAHVVLSAERDPGRLLSDLKARASRDLTQAGFDSAERRRWTRQGSTRYLFCEDEVQEKIHYTLNEQGDPMAWYAHDKAFKEPRAQ